MVISYVFAATYTATISDLSNNFANVNGGNFLVNDSVTVSTAGGHNIAQIGSKSCSSGYLSGGLECCDVVTNNNCGCAGSSFTLTFSTNGTYFFKCFVTGHCSGLGLLGQITFNNPTTPTSNSHHNSTNTTSSKHTPSSNKSGAERLISGFGLLFVASFILLIQFVKIF